MPELEQILASRVRELSETPLVDVGLDTPLLGESGILDSLKLVRLCLELEELAEEQGFEFDWTSDTAMSRSRSFLRTLRSLIAEFEAQKAGT